MGIGVKRSAESRCPTSPRPHQAPNSSFGQLLFTSKSSSPPALAGRRPRLADKDSNWLDGASTGERSHGCGQIGLRPCCYELRRAVRSFASTGGINEKSSISDPHIYGDIGPGLWRTD